MISLTRTSARSGNSTFIDHPVTSVIRSSKPFARKFASTSLPMSVASTAYTRAAPTCAAAIASTPVPVPISTTTSPGLTTCRIAASKLVTRCRSLSMAMCMGPPFHTPDPLQDPPPPSASTSSPARRSVMMAAVASIHARLPAPRRFNTSAASTIVAGSWNIPKRARPDGSTDAVRLPAENFSLLKEARWMCRSSIHRRRVFLFNPGIAGLLPVLSCQCRLASSVKPAWLP